MQTGISSASLYPQQPTETAILNIAALGCRSVEVFLQTRREYSRQYVIKLDALCSQLEMKVSSLHAASSQYEPMLFYNYKRQNLDGKDILNQVLEAAAVLGADCYVFHGPLRIANLDQDRLLEGLAWISGAAASWGVKLALENVSWCAGWSPAVFKWLTRQDVPNLFYTFDSKQALRSGFGAGDYIDAMGSRLINVHLSDGRGGIPGDDHDLAPLAATLKASGYEGPVILEVYGTKVESIRHLAQGWQKLAAQFR